MTKFFPLFFIAEEFYCCDLPSISNLMCLFLIVHNLSHFLRKINHIIRLCDICIKPI